MLLLDLWSDTSSLILPCSSTPQWVTPALLIYFFYTKQTKASYRTEAACISDQRAWDGRKGRQGNWLDGQELPNQLMQDVYGKFMDFLNSTTCIWRFQLTLHELDELHFSMKSCWQEKWSSKSRPSLLNLLLILLLPSYHVQMSCKDKSRSPFRQHLSVGTLTLSDDVTFRKQ